METTSENLGNSSSSGSAASGFPVGRPNISSSSVLKWKGRNRYMKAKKQRVLIWSKNMPWHAVFAFVNPLLIGVLQVECQGTGVSPFDAHPIYMWTFLLATLVYCFAFAANIKCRRRRTNHAMLSGNLALISGSLSSVSLVSIFLPTLWLGQLIHFLWIVLHVVVLRQSISCVCRWPCRRIKNAISRLLGVVNRFMDGHNQQPQPQLPV